MRAYVSYGVLAAGAALVWFAVSSLPDGQAAASKPADSAQSQAAPSEAAIARSRKQVKMLDDIYKQTIVLITDKYVEDVTDFPAGSAAVLLFKNISKTGYHNVRLIDATGQPIVAANVARDAFEKQGLKQIKSGKAYFDKVQMVDGEPHLRAITAVPVVLKKCIMCHEHYGDVEKGEAIGAISYSIPIE